MPPSPRQPASRQSPRTEAPAKAADAPAAKDAAIKDAPSIPGYRITGRLGEGGMGVVWAGVQLSTKRNVALKLLSAAGFASQRAKARFTREVELAASLQHPNVARVYDSGLDHGVWYYAMELVHGVPLDHFVLDSKLTLVQTLELMTKLSLALQHAHQRGILHRDLKPSNILVSADSEPHILDFGLAKDLEHDATLQVSVQGDVSGTPAYMSPEQAAGQVDKIDTRSDVYSLGVILYQLLTKKRPHDITGSNLTVLRRIAEDEIVPPRQAMPELDAELEAILLKSLARDPQERYASAGELAADLRRFLDGEPISARPATTTYFLLKRLKKNRGRVALAAAVVVLLLATAVGAYVRVTLERNRADREAHAALIAADKEKQAYEQLRSNQQALLDAHARADQQARAATESAEKERKAKEDAVAAAENERKAKSESQTQRQLAELRLADALCIQAGAHAAASEGIAAMRLHHEASELLSHWGKSYPLDLELLEVELKQPSPIATYPARGLVVGAIDNGATLVSLRQDRLNFDLWDPVTGRVLRTIGPSPSPIRVAVLSPTGRTLAAGCEDGTLALWSVADRKHIADIQTAKSPVTCLAISPDDSTAVAGYDKPLAHVYDLKTSQLLFDFDKHKSRVIQLSFTSDSREIISSDAQHTVKVFAARTGVERLNLSPRFSVTLLATPSAGGVLASCDHYGGIELWDLTTGQRTAQTGSPESGVNSLAFSSDAQLLLVAHNDGQIVSLDSHSLQLKRKLLGHAAAANNIGPLGPAGLCWSCDSDGNACVWNLAEPSPLKTLPTKNGSAPDLSPDALLVAQVDGEGRLILWDYPTSKLLKSTRTPLNAVRFIPQSRNLLAITGKTSMAVWDTAQSKELRRLKGTHPSGVSSFTTSDDGALAAAGRNTGVVDVWSIPDGHQLARLSGHSAQIAQLMFTSSNQQLLTGSGDGSIRQWNLPDAKPIRTVASPHREVASFILTSNQSVIAGDTSGYISSWNLASGSSLKTFPWRLPGHPDRIAFVGPYPDPSTLASINSAGALRLWNTGAGDELYAFFNLLGGQLWTAHLHQAQIFAASASGEVRLLDLTRIARQRSLADAANKAREILATSSQDPSALAVLGQWYAFRGAWPWAISLLETARRGGADVASLPLARCYWHSGNFDAAAREFHRALQRREADDFYIRLCLDAVGNEAHPPSIASPETNAPVAAPAPVPAPAPHGSVGVATWQTDAEFKDLRVTSGTKVLLQSDFSRGLGAFKPSTGTWSVRGGTLRQTTTADNCRATAGNPTWTDYIITVKARKIAGREGFIVMFHVADDQNFLWWNVGGWSNTRTAIEKSTAGNKQTLGDSSDTQIEANRWYDVKIELQGTQIRCYLDGKLITQTNDP